MTETQEMNLRALLFQMGDLRKRVEELERRDLPVGPTRNAYSLKFPTAHELDKQPLGFVELMNERILEDMARSSDYPVKQDSRSQPSVVDKLEEMCAAPVEGLDMQTALEMITQDGMLTATWGDSGIWIVARRSADRFVFLKFTSGHKQALRSDMLTATWRVEKR